MTYSHRNGEEEAPTIPGLFLYEGYLWGAGNIEDELDVTVDAKGDLVVDGLYLDSFFPGQWWGPIVGVQV